MIGGKRFVIQREISVLQFYPRKDSFLAVQLLRIFSVFSIFSRKLRAAVCKYREFAVKTEISKIFIVSQKKSFGETFSKITIKVSKDFFFFFEKTGKKWNAAPRHIVAGLKPLNDPFSKPSERKTVQGNKFIFGR